ncbi:MAG TPA: PAS domain-containing protein, partial [Arenimonas sp.]|nr:PAS domain-containing protein [Arenimonas sp.]
MQLSAFIRSNTETILLDWDAFAESLLSTPGMSKEGLRDHAGEMLLAIAKDIDTAQSSSEQAAKSKGVEGGDKKESWAKVHGRARHASGFDVNETVSEFRALRASVLSRWTKAATHIAGQDLEDLTRFNEAIDQAVAESLKQYSTEKEMQTRLFGAVLVASPDPIGVLDLKGKYIYANKAMGYMFALPCEAIIGKTNAALRLPLAAEFQRHLRKVIAQQSAYRGEATYRSSVGEARRYEYELAPVLDAKGCCEAIVCIYRDITERTGLEEEARHSAHHDPLTGLPNRRLFLDRLDQAFKHAKRRSLPLALLYVDLDGFKEVN